MKFLLQVIFFFFAVHPFALYANNLFGSVKVSFDDEIDIKTHAEIKTLNIKLLRSFKTNTPSVMFDMFDDENREKGITPIEKLYQHSAQIITSNTFYPSHDFLALYHGGGIKISPVTSPSPHEFLTYITLTPDTPKYVSIMESRNGVKDLLLVFVYEKNGMRWNLNTFHTGTHRIGGKTPVDWFHEAEQIEENGHTLPAFLRLALAMQYLRPAPFIHYRIENDIRELASRCRKELEKYSYPISLDTDPLTKLINISPRFYQGEVIPLAKYLSQISLTEEDLIRSEAKTLVPLLIKYFPGFSSYGKNMAFKAINESLTDANQSDSSFMVLIPVKEGDTHQVLP